MVKAPARKLAGKIGLDDYLKQVRGNNQAYVGAVKASEALKSQAVEGDAIFSPIFFASAFWNSDSRKTNAPSFQGTKTNYDVYTLGIGKVTSFGLDARLSYNVFYTSISGASPAALPISKFYDARPQLEFTQSLWKNGFGKETRSKSELANASLLKLGYETSFRARQLISQAEASYWRLSLARASVDVQQQTLERASTILDWAKRRVGNDLADKADLLQAEAAFEMRALELQRALDEEQAAARAFNSQLGVESDEVTSEVESFDPNIIHAISVPKRDTMRDDVKAAEQDERVARANSELTRQKYAPTLDLVGTIALNGRNATLNPSIDESFTSQYPQSRVGVNFNMPLDFGVVSDAREAALVTRQAAELTYRRRLFDQEREWTDLTRRFYQAKRRFELALGIEELQRKKVTHEKSRLDKGRTTTFQVILMEGDYAAARLTKLQAASEILTLSSSLKTFGGEL